MKSEPPFMWARIECFSPGVQGTGIRVMHNVPLLLETQSADSVSVRYLFIDVELESFM